MAKEDYISKDNLTKVLKQISNLAKQSVLVGIPDDSPERHDGEISNAQLAYVQNYGSPAAGIPARPFMEPGIEDAKERISAQLKKGSRALMDGDLHTANQAMNAAGLIAVNSIKNKITDGDFEPLKPATVKRKGSDKPLVDTGSMRNAITYLIVSDQENE
jgi:hypothetical protein